MTDGGFEQMYREVILHHYKNPRGHGVLEHADAGAEGAPEPPRAAARSGRHPGAG